MTDQAPEKNAILEAAYKQLCHARVAHEDMLFVKEQYLEAKLTTDRLAADLSEAKKEELARVSVINSMNTTTARALEYAMEHGYELPGCDLWIDDYAYLESIRRGEVDYVDPESLESKIAEAEALAQALYDEAKDDGASDAGMLGLPEGEPMTGDLTAGDILVIERSGTSTTIEIPPDMPGEDELEKAILDHATTPEVDATWTEAEQTLLDEGISKEAVIAARMQAKKFKTERTLGVNPPTADLNVGELVPESQRRNLSGHTYVPGDNQSTEDTGMAEA